MKSGSKDRRNELARCRGGRPAVRCTPDLAARIVGLVAFLMVGDGAPLAGQHANIPAAAQGLPLARPEPPYGPVDTNLQAIDPQLDASMRRWTMALQGVEEKPAEKASQDKQPSEKKATDAKASAKKPDESKKDKKDDASDETKTKAWHEKLNIRGYTQFRYNSIVQQAPGSAEPNAAGDASIAPDQNFLISRARIILYGDISDHLYIYLQPDFANVASGESDRYLFGQMRDWYGDVYFDKDKVHRLRVGQSKVPYCWEVLQSSQNRIVLDRNDAFNSTTPNQRDLGVFYYWTPLWAQDTFRFVMDEGLKGSGNYGVFGFGVCNGQGGSLRELNDELTLVGRLALPITLSNGQIVEFDVQALQGRYVVRGAEILPGGTGPARVPWGTRGQPFGDDGMLNQRLGWTAVFYPQPFGFQAEYTIGRGPELNADQTQVVRDSLQGGYALWNYRCQMPRYGELWPYLRYQWYDGGYTSAPNAPHSIVREWNYGVEWQVTKEMELVCEYMITDRTNLRPMETGPSYGQFEGQLLRFQFQINY